jgi:hypothetical protein
LFNGDIQTKLLLAGNCWGQLTERGFLTAKDTERTETLDQFVLRADEMPRKFIYPTETTIPRIIEVQKLWKESGHPNYYKWLWEAPSQRLEDRRPSKENPMKIKLGIWLKDGFPLYRQWLKIESLLLHNPIN